MAAGTLCLGNDTGAVAFSVAKGSTATVEIQVKNPGSTASTRIAALVYVAGSAVLPFGQPICTACNSTASKSVIGLEWPALAPGESRTVSVKLPMTGAAGTSAFSVSLYARSLADVLSDEIANGIQPGQQTWKVQLTIG